MHGESLIFGTAIVALVLLALFMVPRLLPNARLRRRLRRTHSRVVSKSRQPSVQLNVKTPGKEK